ncbi:hypothetical protein [Luteimicrobium sp. DT211]|uniref:hypothetical protein n=1 Tax=Luteimicrobium sp. DT211 TaxID=3393412 RepID=UPI003CE732FF
MTPRTQPVPPVPDHDDDVTTTRPLPPSIPPRRSVRAHPQAQASAGRTALPTSTLPVRTPAPGEASTQGTHVPDAHAADDVADRIQERAPRPSGVQITASALAAVSSTLLLSYFGVAGTIIGAGLASVLTVLGNFVYQRSMLRAHEKVAAALRTGARLGAGASAAEAARTTAVSGASSSARSGGGPEATGSSGSGATPPVGSGSADDAEAHAAKRRVRRRLVVAAISLFAAIVAAVTVVELVAGKPLTNVLHGTDGSGTSISDVTGSRSGGGSAPAPTSTTTKDPSDGGSSGTGSTGDGAKDGTTSTPQPTTTPDSSTGSDSSGTGSGGTGSTGDGSTDGGSTGSDSSGSTGSGSTGSDSSGSTGTGSQDGTSTGDQGSTGSDGASDGAGSTQPTSPATTAPTTQSDALAGADAASGAGSQADATS